MPATLKMFQIDAFTDKLFGGNPAAVCVLEEWLEDEKMQHIAAENNLAETAFVVESDGSYKIRWFTPAVEVDLCGHATLAAAYVLFRYHAYPSSKITFQTQVSGELTVESNDGKLTLDFPRDAYQPVRPPQALVDAFGMVPVESYKGKTDYLLLFPTQRDVLAFHPDLNLIASAGGRGVIVSAPGEDVDFVSRFFAPQVGVNEDPVTGSAHTTLTPYWSQKLNKQVLTARQLSKRQGELTCELRGERVLITGSAVTYLLGEIYI